MELLTRQLHAVLEYGQITTLYAGLGGRLVRQTGCPKVVHPKTHSAGQGEGGPRICIGSVIRTG